MKSFPLAGLLRLRNMELDTAAGTLAATNRRAGEARDRRSRALAGLAASETMPADPGSLMAIVAARTALQTELQALTQLEDMAQQDAAAAREAYRAAKMRSVPLEKMEARHQADETAAELKLEQDALDEIAVLRASGDGRQGRRRIETEATTRKAGNASY